jgi:hypothetical protein
VEWTDGNLEIIQFFELSQVADSDPNMFSKQRQDNGVTPLAGCQVQKGIRKKCDGFLSKQCLSGAEDRAIWSSDGLSWGGTIQP